MSASFLSVTLPAVYPSPHSTSFSLLRLPYLKPTRRLSPISIVASKKRLDSIDVEEEEDGEKGFGGRGNHADYEKDPVFAEILGNFFNDPAKAQAQIDERIEKNMQQLLQPKTGSANRMKVIFNKFKFSNSYVWFEFYGPPLPKDVSLICDTLRAWHIIGNLGGYNALNTQLSDAPLENKPSYDVDRGVDAVPTTFHNIGDLEVQENLARVRVEIGTTVEPMLLDVLINALITINSDHVGIKQVVFGETPFANWKDDYLAEEGSNIHKI